MLEKQLLGKTMKKILFILMPKGFQETEFKVPFTMLQDEGYAIDIVGLEAGDAIGHQGTHVKTTGTISKLTPQNIEGYEAVVIPGGPGSVDYLWDNEPLQALVKQFHQKNKIIATICYACIVPVQADILQETVATVYPTNQAKGILAEHGVEFSEEGCVSNTKKRVITAQSPKFAKQFAQAILVMLEH